MIEIKSILNQLSSSEVLTRSVLEAAIHLCKWLELEIREPGISDVKSSNSIPNTWPMRVQSELNHNSLIFTCLNIISISSSRKSTPDMGLLFVQQVPNIVNLTQNALRLTKRSTRTFNSQFMMKSTNYHTSLIGIQCS